MSKVGGSGRGSQIRASRYTADEVMLALANQKIGHEARDLFSQPNWRRFLLFCVEWTHDKGRWGPG
ncbi:hypothetical protein V8C26DRAFT_393555 [Trichoderma gracile]